MGIAPTIGDFQMMVMCHNLYDSRMPSPSVSLGIWTWIKIDSRPLRVFFCYFQYLQKHAAKRWQDAISPKMARTLISNQRNWDSPGEKVLGFPQLIFDRYLARWRSRGR